jgi:hypothetical protein
MSISSYLEPLILDAVFNGTSLSVANTYAKLHTGDPGEDGTANAAGNTTRKLASWAAASGGTIQTDTELRWTSVAATETYTHISFWDAASGGNHLWNGPLAAAYDVNGGDEVFLPAGTIVATLT